MRVLILGGTGAMGQPLAKALSDAGHAVYVTSRQPHEDYGGLHFVTGNAKDESFINGLLSDHYDAIIDFMIYQPHEFEAKAERYLVSTDHYFFLSSSRVYAESMGLITEDSPRLLDVCKDTEYLRQNEYALIKAREENVLFNSSYRNWTVIRPYVTYNDYRLQLGVFEKENWLYRAMNGKSIVFPSDIAARSTTLTWGGDVAEAISRLISNPKAKGEAFHITGSEFLTWQEVLNIYATVLRKQFGTAPKIVLPMDCSSLLKIWGQYQIRYDRLYDRKFDNSKLIDAIGEYRFKPIEDGLTSCLERFIQKPIWRGINYRFELWADIEAKERTKLKDLPGKRLKLEYIYRKLFGYRN